jgi:2-polyprenyl-3-methyl-5-hydroxy-6-metoxy-1,4-benzoquinol methylase
MGKDILEERNYLLAKCVICGSGRIHYTFIRNGYPVYQCGDCDFMFLNPQPSDEILSEIYKSDYFLMGNCEGSEELRTQMKSATARLYINQLINYYGKREGNLLEIGCGNGDFLVVAKAMGFNVKGIEISEYATRIANRKLEEESVICGDFEKVDLPEEYFEVCVLFDVIEHVRNPINFLERIHKHLKPKGIIFIVTPSLDSWSAKLLKNSWMEFKAEHLQYFDTQTIQNALAKTGFQNTYISPNYKFLQIEYIREHFQRYHVPFFTKLVKALTHFLPLRIKRNNIKFMTSGINILSQKVELREKPLVSIIVPVYNEVKTFPVLIKSLISKEIQGMDKEIIIIESNSNDGSREEVLRYEGISGVKIIFEEKAKGKGHAVRNGLEYAKGDFVVIQDGDLEYDLNDYEQLLEPLRRYQKAFVLGSRHLKGWKMRQFEDQRFISFVMNVGQKFFKTLLNIFCGQNLNDPFTMYKVFRRDCLFGLTLKANRFDFDWELVIKLLRKGYVPLEIPVNYKSRSFKDGKKISFIRDPILWIEALIRFRFGKLYQNRYERDRTD